MPDLDFQNFSTVQSGLQPKPNTIASAATIAPTTFLTRLTGAVAVTTITPPVTGCHMLALSFAGVSGVATGGNVQSTVASVADRPMLLIYNPVTATYFVVTVA
jgi:hypothetical protein